MTESSNILLEPVSKALEVQKLNFLFCRIQAYKNISMYGKVKPQPHETTWIFENF